MIVRIIDSGSEGDNMAAHATLRMISAALPGLEHFVETYRNKIDALCDKFRESGDLPSLVTVSTAAAAPSDRVPDGRDCASPSQAPVLDEEESRERLEDVTSRMEAQVARVNREREKELLQSLGEDPGRAGDRVAQGQESGGAARTAESVG